MGTIFWPSADDAELIEVEFIFFVSDEV